MCLTIAILLFLVVFVLMPLYNAYKNMTNVATNSFKIGMILFKLFRKKGK